MADPTFLDNYSPFDEPATPTDPPSLTQARIDPGGPHRPTPLPRSSALSEDQLRAYEDRLNVLEETINGQELRVRESGRLLESDPPPNWPRCYPVVHYNIEDVPESNRGFVHSALFAWVLMALAFALNWIGCLSLISVSDEAIESPGSKIALSSLYLFIVVPLALDLDAVAVYRALQGRSSTFTFLKIFAALAATAGFELMMFLGLEESGSVGLISTIELFAHKHVGVGAWGAVVTAMFFLALLIHLRFIRKLWKFYRGTAEGENIETDVRRGVTEFVVESLS
jgi:hypothetical protein